MKNSQIFLSLLFLLSSLLIIIEANSSFREKETDLSVSESALKLDEEQEQESSNDATVDIQCQKNNDCEDLFICNTNTFKCERKQIFPMTLMELIGSILIIIIVGIGQAAGVGGGLIVVPLLMSFFGYEAKKSIALVFVTVFAASLLNVSNYMKQTYKNGPVIDYKLVTLSLPTIMIGSVYGVSFNKFLPMAAISCLLIFFILQSLMKTYKSYKTQKAKETKENEEHRLQQLEDLSQPLTSSQKQSNSKINSARQYPRDLIKKIILITIVFITFSLLRGGQKFDSLIDIPPCGVLYHLCNLGMLCLSYLLVKAIIAGILIGEKLDQQLNLSVCQERQPTNAEMGKFAQNAFLAGFIGSIVGIGGGMILIPNWLDSGIPSQKTPACSITLIFLTALNSVIQFSLSGIFRLEEYIYFSILALISSYFISQAISEYVKTNNKSSLLIFLILCFMIAALIIFSSLTVEKAMQNPDSLYEFGDFC